MSSGAVGGIKVSEKEKPRSVTMDKHDARALSPPSSPTHTASPSSFFPFFFPFFVFSPSARIHDVEVLSRFLSFLSLLCVQAKDVDIEAGPEPPPTPGGGDRGMESFFSEVAMVKEIMERIRRSLVKLQVGKDGVKFVCGVGVRGRDRTATVQKEKKTIIHPHTHEKTRERERETGVVAACISQWTLPHFYLLHSFLYIPHPQARPPTPPSNPPPAPPPPPPPPPP